MPSLFKKKEKVVLHFGPANKTRTEIRRGAEYVMISEMTDSWTPAFLQWRYRRTKFKDKRTPIFVCIGPEWDDKEIF